MMSTELRWDIGIRRGSMLEGVVSLLIAIWIVTMILYSTVYVVLKYVFRIKVERFDWMLLLASLGVVLIRALFIWDELCLVAFGGV